MTIPFNHLRVKIHIRNIVHNYELLRLKVDGVMAVIKADAYGHGLIPVAQALSRAGCETFAVGTPAEGAALRGAGVPGEIISLLGPLDADECLTLREFDIIPFIHSFEQLDMLGAVAARGGEVFPVALKWDTGMRRLGFAEADVKPLLARLRAMPGVRVAYAASHLATADEPEAFGFADEQAAVFGRVCEQLKAAGLSFKASLANSAGILAHPDKHFDAQRAGIALYGANPFYGTDKEALGRDLRPAMEVATRIVSVHALKKGETISYGRTYAAARDMRVAVVAAGYADAYSRSLSNRGRMCLGGKRVPVLGRVCMQLTAVDVSDAPQAGIGDEIHLLGGSGEGAIRPEELAAWWGSIPYEAFCLLGLNRREYV